MKKLIVMLIIVLTSLSACIQNPARVQPEKPKITTVQIDIVADKSKSFVNRYTAPLPGMFKATIDRIAKAYTIDLRYGFVTDSSNASLIRFYQQYEEKKETASNPWLTGEEATTKYNEIAWNNFEKTVTPKLAARPTDNSDIASTLNRVIVSFQEYDSTTTRKILILCTDLEDSYTTLPHIPQDVEVYTVGLMPNVPVNKILGTNRVKRYESLESAITAIKNSFSL